MTDSDCITPWLQHLRILMPPDGVILVGAGAGTGQWVQMLQEWSVPNATLVEADDAQFKHLQRSVAQHDGWRLLNEVVAAQPETVNYYQASNSSESGLLDPESLRGLWPNIKTSEKRTREAIALTELLQDAPTPANWLMVDCLPALPIIEGASDLLDTLNVIAARVLIDETDLSDGKANLATLQNYLSPRGYRLLATQTGRHPAVGHALFVRDVQVLIRSLRQQQAQAVVAQQAEERTAQVELLTQAKAAAEKLAADRQAKIDTLEKQVKQLQEADSNLKQRQQVLREELTSAEAQIELIKDLLLREDAR